MKKLRSRGGHHRDTVAAAAGSGDIEAVKQFIAAGADVNAKDGTGSTALDTAEEAAAELLRKHGGKTAEGLKAAGK